MVLHQSGAQESDLDASHSLKAGLAGALLVGAAFANSFAFGLGIHAIGVHHLEGHLLSPLLEEIRRDFRSSRFSSPEATLSLMRVGGVGNYEMLGETLDDAAGEAFDRPQSCSAWGTRAGRRCPGWPNAGRGIASRFRAPCSTSSKKAATSISASAG